MKTVVSSSMVAHLWAHQSQALACNATRSMSFDGPVIYSYRTPIAMIHDTRGGRVVLVTSERYSVTTQSRHMPEVMRAYQGLGYRVFHVPYVGAYGGYAPSRAQRPEEWHAVNVAHLADEYRELGGRIRRAVWTQHYSRESVQEALQGAADIVRDYCDAFRLPKRFRPLLDPADDARVIWRARELREERAADPKNIAKREAAKAARERRIREREEREARERFERDTKAREAFRAGAVSGGYRVSDERGGALLRVRGDIVQTSWGAEVPADDARAAWPLVLRVRERGEAFRPTGLHGIKLGAFAVTAVELDGTIRAGCHRIHWPEIEACARALGLLPGRAQGEAMPRTAHDALPGDGF